MKGWLLARYSRVSQACGAMVSLISTAALVGWFTGSAILKGVRPAYIPMAPNTALVFVMNGLCLIVIGSPAHRFSRLARVAIAVAAMLAVARMREYLSSLELRIVHWICR